MTTVHLLRCDACEAESRLRPTDPSEPSVVGWAWVTVARRSARGPGQDDVREYDLCPSCLKRWDIL